MNFVNGDASSMVLHFLPDKDEKLVSNRSVALK